MERLPGFNSCTLSGNVGRITFSETKDGTPAASFWIASQEVIEDQYHSEKTVVTWVRVNVYDKVALYCKQKLKDGGYAIVHGKLKNRVSRQSGDRITEIRAREIIIIDRADLVDGGYVDAHADKGTPGDSAA